MSEFTETLLSLAFMFLGLYFFVKTFEGIDRRLDSDRDRDERLEERRHARRLESAQLFGYEGSKLQKESQEGTSEEPKRKK
jgi:hypothetical protein